MLRFRSSILIGLHILCVLSAEMTCVIRLTITIFGFQPWWRRQYPTPRHIHTHTPINGCRYQTRPYVFVKLNCVCIRNNFEPRRQNPYSLMCLALPINLNKTRVNLNVKPSQSSLLVDCDSEWDNRRAELSLHTGRAEMGWTRTPTSSCLIWCASRARGVCVAISLNLVENGERADWVKIPKQLSLI